MDSTNLEFFSVDELHQIGFAAIGAGVQIDRTCRFTSASRIQIGSHVRIDAYSTIRAGEDGIRIGDYVHLSSYTSIAGAGRVEIQDYCGLSARVSIFSSNDDYSGGHMTNPMIPDRFKDATSAPVTLRKHAIIGAHSVILPGVTLGVGASVGALSLVNRSVPDFMIVSGNPIQRVGQRSKQLLELEDQFRKSLET